MKVNPSYAGFEFQNVNRATDESQREAFKQRGFRVLLRVLETGLNQGLVPYLLTEEDLRQAGVVEEEDEDVDPAEATDLVLKFERERTTGEKQERARMLQDAVEAGGAAADRGLDVTFRDGFPEIEDGEVEETEDTGGGGLFASTDSPHTLEKAELSEADVRRAYEVAGNEFDPTEAESPVVLTFPPGGVPYSAEAGTKAWEALFRDIMDRGANAVLDLYSKQGAADLRAFPDSLPSDHDPGVAVYGLSESAVGIEVLGPRSVLQHHLCDADLRLKVAVRQFVCRVVVQCQPPNHRFEFRFSGGCILSHISNQHGVGKQQREK